MSDIPQREFRLSPGLTRFTPIPNEVLRRTDLSAEAKVLYALIIDIVQFQRGDPTQMELGKALGGSDKVARSACRELIDVGLMVSQRRGQGQSNIYTLMDPDEISQNGSLGSSRTEVSSDPSLLLRPLEDIEAYASPEKVRRVYAYWREKRGKTRKNYDDFSDQRRKKIQSRLKEFTEEELCTAIDHVARDPWPARSQNDDIIHIFKSREQVERFLEMPARGARLAPIGSPFEQAKAWVISVGWRWPDADIMDELGARFGVTGEEKQRLVDIAFNLQKGGE